MVLANQESALNWCALEIQAVYFSGRSMGEEFRSISPNPPKGRELEVS